METIWKVWMGWWRRYSYWKWYSHWKARYSHIGEPKVSSLKLKDQNKVFLAHVIRILTKFDGNKTNFWIDSRYVCPRIQPYVNWLNQKCVLTPLYPWLLRPRASQVALVVKNQPANARDLRDMGSIPGSGRFPGVGHSNPLQYSCLENPMDRGAWWAMIHRIAMCQTRRKWLHTNTYS